MKKEKDSLVITAAKLTHQYPDYSVRQYDEKGSIPNWFIGVILALKDEIEDDEKIVIRKGHIQIVKKTRWDNFKEWLFSL